VVQGYPRHAHPSTVDCAHISVWLRSSGGNLNVQYFHRGKYPVFCKFKTIVAPLHVERRNKEVVYSQITVAVGLLTALWRSSRYEIISPGVAMTALASGRYVNAVRYSFLPSFCYFFFSKKAVQIHKNVRNNLKLDFKSSNRLR